MPVLLLISASGVAMVAFAFAAGRANDSWGVPLYWLGEIVFFAPLVFGVVSRRRLNETAIIGLLIGLGLATFLIRYSYSPIQFSFPDELQHWRGTQQVLTTHHLFTFNASLPISPNYPGLEIVTSALVQLTGLSIFSAGMIVIAVVHVLFTIGLFVLLKLIFPDVRVAAAGTLIYATEPHFQSFDAIFAYQTFALPFLALSLAATAQLIQERGAASALVVGCGDFGHGDYCRKPSHHQLRPSCIPSADRTDGTFSAKRMGPTCDGGDMRRIHWNMAVHRGSRHLRLPQARSR